MRPVLRPADPRVLSSLSSDHVLPRRTTDCWHQAKDHARQQGEPHGESQHRRLQCNCRQPGHLLRAHGHKGPDASEAQREPADTSKHREDHALGQHLTKQPSPAGAKRRADRELTISARGPHEQKVGDVGAGDQEDEQDEQLQEVEGRAKVPHELIADGHAEAAEAARLGEGLALRQTFQVAIDDGLHLRVDLFERRARLQPRDHLAELVAAPLVGHLLRRERERHQHGHVTAGQLEVRGQDAEDLMRFPAEANRPANDGAIGGKTGVPQVVAEDRKLVGARLRFRLDERPAEEGLPLQRRKEGWRDRQATNLDRFALGSQAQPAHREERRVLDGRRLRLAIDVVRNRNARLLQSHQRVGIPDEDQALGVGIRQRPQHVLIEEAENRRVGANPQRQGGHRHERENRLLPQRAEGVAKVLHGGVGRSPGAEGFFTGPAV